MADSTLMSRRDLEFMLHEWLQVDQLTGRERYADHDRQSFDDVLELSEKVATTRFATINRILDTDEPTMNADGVVEQPAALREALAAYRESGLGGSFFDAEDGGLQLPHVVHQAASTWFLAASVGAFAYAFLAAGNAHLVAKRGSAEQRQRFAHPVIEGRWLGTMCLSEPQAGSSLGDITTTAVREADGSYRLTGTKMWISGGDHELSENIVHLVLARTPGAPAGVRGLSLFIVPKFLVADDGTLGERNDVTLVGLNHKMGYRGTTNTLLAFGEGRWQPGGCAGAVGHLVGAEGEGLAHMFQMMNQARVAVGAGAVALGYTGYLHALEYARVRTQGRPLGDKESAAPVPLVAHPDVRRMLLAQKSYVEGGLALVLYSARLLDEVETAPDVQQREDARILLDLLTPITKAWPSQWCLHANDLAIQVHGGYGYTRDFPVEQFYRDNRLNPIHEGTTGIQALDLLGRKMLLEEGRGLRLLTARIEESVEAARAEGGEVAQYAEELRRAAARIPQVVAAAWGTGAAEEALGNATAFLEGVGHVVVAWMWLAQMVAAEGRQGSFYEGKRAAARYFYRFELPQVGPKFDLVARRDRTVLDIDTGWL